MDPRKLFKRNELASSAELRANLAEAQAALPVAEGEVERLATRRAEGATDGMT